MKSREKFEEILRKFDVTEVWTTDKEEFLNEDTEKSVELVIFTMNKEEKVHRKISTELLDFYYPDLDDWDNEEWEKHTLNGIEISVGYVADELLRKIVNDEDDNFKILWIRSDGFIGK